MAEYTNAEKMKMDEVELEERLKGLGREEPQILLLQAYQV